MTAPAAGGMPARARADSTASRLTSSPRILTVRSARPEKESERPARSARSLVRNQPSGSSGETSCHELSGEGWRKPERRGVPRMARRPSGAMRASQQGRSSSWQGWAAGLAVAIWDEASVMP